MSDGAVVKGCAVRVHDAASPTPTYGVVLSCTRDHATGVVMVEIAAFQRRVVVPRAIVFPVDTERWAVQQRLWSVDP